MKIILPDFLLHTQGLPVPPLSTLALPALTTLLRGQTSPVRPGNIWQYLATTEFAWPGMAPIMLGHDIPGAPAGFWLRADPVLLRPSLDNLILFPSDGLAVTQEEANALVQSLNQLFSDNGMTFYAPTPARWYVHCQVAPDVSFTDLDVVLGRQIDHFLPQGPQALLWHRYLNEIQMLFYTHPVNEARAQAKRQMIPSVWFWGAGHAPLPPQPTSTLQVCSDQQEMCWQAQALGYLAQQFSADRLAHCRDDTVWIIQALSHALMTRGIAGWQAAVEQIDQHYLQPALVALKAKQIAQIELLFAGDKVAYQVITCRTDCWKIWRAKPQNWIEKISP